MPERFWTLNHADLLAESMTPQRRAAVLAVAMTAFCTFLDFTVPGEFTVAILYASSVVASGWTGSARFVWGTTLACIALTYSGLAFGPQPPEGLLPAFYINRSLVALGLLLIAVLVQQRQQMIYRIEHARDAEMEQNRKLTLAQAELNRARGELESRVVTEVDRRMKAEQELQQVQKIEAIGQLAGGIAHDFNNILAIIIGNLEMIRTRLPEGDSCRRLAENGLMGAKQGAAFTKQLLAFARRQPFDPEVIEIDRTVNDVIALARHVMPHGIELRPQFSAEIWRVYVDRAGLQSALLNLMINARDAMPDGGRITVSGENTVVGPDNVDLTGGSYVRLSVLDTGCGMTPEVVARAFEPFFTTKNPGRGTGLGLSMVHGFVSQCGGAVRIDSAPGRGTGVHLYLPRTQ